MIPSLQTMAPRNSFLHPLLPLLLYLSLTICISISISSASNLLTTNQTLSGDQKLTSQGINFVLGFFTTTNTSSKFYIGIWYSKVSKLKPVWVANRDTPVSDTNSSVLKISQLDSNLVLLDQDKSKRPMNTRRLLVYDHMPNGSLDAHLFQNIPNVFSWNTRYNIALGISRGLVYLHDKCRDCIIHCDIKPENILLDDSFAPKVSDFGLAKLVGRDFSRVLTTMRGTRGYLAPEWIYGVPITPKADAYSYGMMLFEIISGRRNTDTQLEEKEGPPAFFPKVVARKLIEGEVLSLLDPWLEGDGNEEEISRVCNVAFWCIQDNEFFRPTMGQVVQILEGVLEVNMPPIPRSLEVLSENEGSIVFFSDSSSNHSSHMKSTTSNSFQTKST